MTNVIMLMKNFARAGIPETIAVASDSGMMGGSLLMNLMLLAREVWRRFHLQRYAECGYKANP